MFSVFSVTLIFNKSIYIKQIMKLFRYNISLVLVIMLLLVSCKKEEQSCQDGIYTAGSEEETDCGGVCPPCEDGNSPAIQEFLSANVEGEDIIFSDRSLTHSTDWVLNFQNDSLSVSLNFGSGDSLGARPIDPVNSGSVYQSTVHSNLTEGTVLFSAIDQTENRLSGYFECKFVSNENSMDTLIIKGGDFENIPWQ
jgi:hypothetical protein